MITRMRFERHDHLIGTAASLQCPSEHLVPQCVLQLIAVQHTTLRPLNGALRAPFPASRFRLHPISVSLEKRPSRPLVFQVRRALKGLAAMARGYDWLADLFRR